jgi:hypothetical protein
MKKRQIEGVALRRAIEADEQDVPAALGGHSSFVLAHGSSLGCPAQRGSHERAAHDQHPVSRA